MKHFAGHLVGSLLLFLVTLLALGWGTAQFPSQPAHSSGLGEREGLGALAAPATLAGPRQVVVRDLPPIAGTATGQAQEVLAPRTFPPEWAAGPLSPAPAANALDASFSAQSESNTPPAVSAADFDGLDNDDNDSITGVIVRPPDPQLAVGPNHVFEMINIVGRIYSRTGATLQSFALTDFFGVPSGYLDTDPKIIYDTLSGRWFASYVSFRDRPGPRNDEGRLHIAISQTSDPMGIWNVYFLSYGEVFPDYAGIGVTGDKFTLSSNIFDIDGPVYLGVHTVVIEKADVMAGVAGSQVGLDDFGFDLNRFTVRPAHSLSAVDDQYMVTRSRTSSTTLTVIRITGTPNAGNVTEASATDLTIISQTAPPESVTAEGESFDSGDSRMLDAMWREGSLWISASAACVPEGDSTTRSCAHLIEVNASPPTSPTIAQDIMFGAPEEYYSWPAVRTDASGDVYVSLTHANSTIFAEARAAGRLVGEPANTMSGSTLLRAGDVVYTGGRWGDYLAAAVDPNFPECVWLVGQYAKDTASSSAWDWGTYIAATSYSGGCDGDDDGAQDGTDNCPSTSNPFQEDADSDGLGDACDPCPENPDCDGDSLGLGDPFGLFFRDEVELFLGTLPLVACPATSTPDDEDPDALGPDFDDSQDVDGSDIFLFAQRFGTESGVPPPVGKLPYIQRFDVYPTDASLNKIDGSDVFVLATYFGKSCP